MFLFNKSTRIRDLFFFRFFSSVLLAKPLMSGTLLSIVVNSVLLAKPLISEILLSTVVILPSISVIFELNVLVCNNPLTSGIFNSKLPTLVS